MKGFFYFYFLSQLSLIRAEHFEICENEEEDVYVAGLDGCDSYIFCSGEDSFMGNCPDGTLFDTEGRYCDEPEYVDCPADEEYNYVEEEYEIDEIEDDSETSTKSNSNKIDYSAECPNTDDPDTVIFLPSETFCSEFYLCYHGNAIQMQCAEYLHFNPEKNKCDFPYAADCKLDNSRSDGNNNPSETKPQQEIVKCQSLAIEFYAHTERCDYFYYCLYGILTVQQCPFYYCWDEIEKACEFRGQTNRCYCDAKTNNRSKRL